MKKAILFLSAVLFGCDRENASQNEITLSAIDEVPLEHHFDICNFLEIKLSAAPRDDSDAIFYDFQKNILQSSIG